MSTTKDVNGKDSHKRKWSAKYLFTALAMGVLYFISLVIASFIGIKLNFQFPYELWFGIAGIGGGLAGFTVFEKKNQ
jgi:multidrug transporter EmrE-like cation transporter